MYTIETARYNKAMLHPLLPGQRRGYQLRDLRLSGYRSLIVHTTNGAKGSTLHGEALYLVNSNIVSAHYLIGKQGQIIQILDPRRYIAWHTGAVRAMKYSNVYAIGIEMHNTPAEGNCTVDQLNALNWLVRKLLVEHTIDYLNVETHRWVAVPAGRKIDPSGFPNELFYAWRNDLKTRQYRVINTRGVNIRQAPCIGNNIAGTLKYNDIFIGGDIKDDENGQYINGTNKWVHLKQMVSGDPSNTNLGFVHMSNLVLI